MFSFQLIDHLSELVQKDRTKDTGTNFLKVHKSTNRVVLNFFVQPWFTQLV
jgi:hypothetical protein